MKKNVFKISLLIALFALSFSTFAQQTVSLFGNVSNDAGNPLANQLVQLNGIDGHNTYDSVFVVTNDAGDYSVNITVYEDSVAFLISTYAEECNENYYEYVPIYGDVNQYETNFIVCGDGPGNCFIEFFYYIEGNDFFTLNFEGFASDSSNFSDWTWEFGDGATGSGQEIQHTYNQAGEYWVTLMATSDECGTLTYEEIVYVDDPWGGDTIRCFADFYYDIDSLNGYTAYFYDYSYSEFEISSWYWEFGDGEVSNEQNPVHEYTEEGEYYVTLTIESGDICSSSYEDIIWIGENNWYPEDCQAFFWAEYNNEEYQTVYFEDLSWGGYGSQILAWEWSFGDGNTSSLQNPTYTFDEDGEYIVTLTIYTDSCTNTFEQMLYIEDYGWGDCQTIFFPEFSDNLSVQFYDLSTPEPEFYFYEFGDGQTSEEAEPLHTYAEEGEYFVTLFTATEDSCYSAFEMEIYVGQENMKSGGSYIIRAYAITPEDSPLSIDNPSNTLENLISVYPNPVVNELNINVTEQVENVTVNIYNVAGQLVINENFSDNNISVNTANLTQGVYIAKININGKISTVKFVK